MKKMRVGLNLSRQKERHVKYISALGEAFSNTFFLGVGIRHVGSVLFQTSRIRRQDWTFSVQPSRLTAGTPGKCQTGERDTKPWHRARQI